VTDAAVAPNPLAEGLYDYRVAEPALMVIFGATGDLSGRKLLPALYNLAKQRLLPAGFAVVGAAIDDLSDDAFRKRAAEKITTFSRTQPVDQQVLQTFLDMVFYLKVDFGKVDDFRKLARKLDELDQSRHVGGNRVFYCATPPATYEAITEQLKSMARDANIPIVGVSETMPVGAQTFQGWQAGQLRLLLNALQKTAAQ